MEAVATMFPCPDNLPTEPRKNSLDEKCQSRFIVEANEKKSQIDYYQYSYTVEAGVGWC